MANRDRSNKTPHHSEIDRRSRPAEHNLSFKHRESDEVIYSLSNSYENRRARQVGEWEDLGLRSARNSFV